MNIAILLSGGVGTRLGADIPKQYINVSGKMLITYCLDTLIHHPLIDAVQIVAEDGWREEILADAEKNGLDGKKLCGFSRPGAERQTSIINALEDLACQSDFLPDTILIHDAARPGLSMRLISECMAALGEHDGVMPVLPMKDTVYLCDDGSRVSGLLDRGKIFAGQAPELFRFRRYLEANKALLPHKIKQVNGSTEPAILAGMDIAIISGEEGNFKITTQADLARFREIVEKSRV